MARLVVGLGPPHSPQLSTPPELWPFHAGRDQRNPGLLDRDATLLSYDK